MDVFLQPFAFKGKNSKNNRIKWIDTARALSILIIVYAHIYNESEISWFVHLFHVPIFFYLSGLVWKDENKAEALKKMFFGLLIPYYFCSIISIAAYLILGKIVSGSGDGLSLIQCVEGMLYANSRTGLMKWNRPLWFIPCLCSVRLIWMIINNVKQKGIKCLLLTGIVCMGLILSYSFKSIMLPFEMEISFVMILYFFFGIITKKYLHDQTVNKKLVNIPMLLVSLIICLFIYMYNGHVSVQYSNYGNFILFLTGSIFGILLVVICAVYLSDLSVLQVIGQNSLSILLWHKFPVLLFQITPIGKALVKNPDTVLGIAAGLIVMAVSVVFCLLVSCVFTWILNRNKDFSKKLC